MERVPIQHSDRKAPVDIAREAYKEYAAQGQGDQSFERLHERGGFGCMEMAMLLFQRIKRIQGEPIPEWPIHFP